MLANRGWVSSTRICRRVRMGLIRAWRSAAMRVIRSFPRRSCTYINAKITVWMTTASVVTMTKKINQLCCIQPPLLCLCLFPLVSISARFDRRRDGLLLPSGHVLATLEQVFGALAELPCLLLRVIAALVCLLREILARLFARLRGKQDPDQRADAQANHEIAYLRSNIIAHGSTSHP